MPTIEAEVNAITKYGIEEMNQPRIRELEARRMRTKDLVKCLGEKELYTFIREHQRDINDYPNSRTTPKWVLSQNEADFYSAYLLSHYRVKMRAWWNDVGRDKFKEWWRSKMVKFRRRIIHDDDDDDEEADANERRRILHDDNDTPPPPPPPAPAPVEEAPLPPPVHANQIGDGGAPDIPAPPAPPRQEKKKKQKKPVPVYHYTLRRRN